MTKDADVTARPTTPSAVPPGQVRLATRATYAAFGGSGFALASWLSRIPQVRERLVLSPGQLGLVLLSIAAGSVIALPLAGPGVTRWGSRRTVSGMAVLLAIGLAGVAVGYLFGVVPVVVGLFLLGFANGAWDVAMNVQGAVVERHLARSIMSRFHAGFSLGTVAGALVGAGLVALGVPVTAHLVAVAIVVGVSVPLSVRWFVPDDGPEDPSDPARTTAGGTAAPGTATDATATPARPRGAWAAWGERRTLLIGVSVLAFAFAEGTGNDWISVAAIDGYGARAAVGTLLFAAFLTAMTIGRWFGPGLLDRFGRVVVVRVLALVAVIGLVLFVFGPGLVTAALGTLLWGLGASLGFPVGMSAGGDEPRYAAARVSVIASIGYCAFLGGPPLVGFLGDQVTVLRAVLVVAVLLGVATLVAGANRPPERG